MTSTWPKEGLWSPEKIWLHQTVFVLGGGPSVNDIDTELLRGAKVVGVNNAYQKWPECQFLLYHDRRWGDWHQHGLANYRGDLITTSLRPTPGLKPKAVLIRKHPPPHISDDPREVVGLDVGAQGVNFAMHLGAKRIVLLGFDMTFDAKTGAAHWHEDHRVASNEANYQGRFAPQYTGIMQALEDRGVALCRGTDAGALTSIPYLPLRSLV